MRREFAYLLWASVFLAGCSRPDSAGVTSDKASAGIRNGALATRQNPLASRVVMITSIASSEANDPGAAIICTGSLLPGNLVLTAAHCFNGVDSESYVDFGLNLPMTDDLEVASYSRKVVARRVLPDYHPQDEDATPSDEVKARLRGNDLAIIKFAGSLPKGYATFALPNSVSVALKPASSDTLVELGYGKTSSLMNTQGQLRVAQIPGTKVKLGDGASTDHYWMLDAMDAGVCGGDSGGPLLMLVSGQPQILGVVSRIADNQGKALDQCASDDFFTRLGPHLEWIQQTARDLAGAK